MENELFQKVFDKIVPLLPDGWKKMVLYAGYMTGSYSMKFYVSDGKSGYTDCFSMKSVEKAKLIKVFMEINKIIALDRNILSEKDQWTVFTLVVDCTGHMKADFDYTDISDNDLEYEYRWKEKYLI